MTSKVTMCAYLHPEVFPKKEQKGPTCVPSDLVTFTHLEVSRRSPRTRVGRQDLFAKKTKCTDQ
jgi:hypothetical protein